MIRTNVALAALLSGLLLPGCTDTTNPGEDNEPEVITTVRLTFTPQSGGDAVAFTWAANDGSPVIDDIVLPAADTWQLSVSFLNELESPPEDITAEVEAEGDQHQVFITGSAVEGPATGTNVDAVVAHAYADTDANGFPVGLENTITPIEAGSGSFIVTLRHLPLEGGAPVKTGTLAEDSATDGFVLPGDVDAEVTFALEVQ